MLRDKRKYVNRIFKCDTKSLVALSVVQASL